MKLRVMVAAAAGGVTLWWLDDVLSRVELHENRLNGMEAQIESLDEPQLKRWAGDVNDHIAKLRDRVDRLESGQNVETILEQMAARYLEVTQRMREAVRPKPPGPATVRGFPDPPSGGDVHHHQRMEGNGERHAEGP